MNAPPRHPRAPLLDPVSLRFILLAGGLLALVGGTFLVVLPRYGYSVTATGTIVFLYVSIAKLIFAYPARRVAAEPSHNLALHVTIGLSIALQLLTAYVPALRTLLGLEQPDGFAMAWLGGAVILSWLVAESFSRLMHSTTQTREQRNA